jgi:hypothetical protein
MKDETSTAAHARVRGLPGVINFNQTAGGDNVIIQTS